MFLLLWRGQIVRFVSQATGWEGFAFAPVKWLAGKIVFEMTISVPSGTLNRSITYSLVSLGCCRMMAVDVAWTVDEHSNTDTFPYMHSPFSLRVRFICNQCEFSAVIFRVA